MAKTGKNPRANPKPEKFDNLPYAEPAIDGYAAMKGFTKPQKS